MSTSTIQKQAAIQRLKTAVRQAGPDDLAEIHNELFPEEPVAEDDATRNQHDVANRVNVHIDSGLEVQEILDLWNVVFPAHRRVWFDEEQDGICYDEEPEPAVQAD